VISLCVALRSQPVFSPILLAPGRCDASQDTATADRSAPTAPGSAHPGGHPSFDSLRSVFFRLSPISRTLRACATITSCPSSLNTRLTHGECIPVSNAIRHCGVPSNASRIAFGVVLTFSSTSTAPDSSSRQYQLDRSPRSNPIVSFACDPPAPLSPKLC
jgi:hypothetical protein